MGVTCYSRQCGARMEGRPMLTNLGLYIVAILFISSCKKKKKIDLKATSVWTTFVHPEVPIIW